MIRRTASAPENREGGFTLVELLVVVVILGILSAVVVVAVRGAGDKGEGAAVATDERIIRTAEEAHCAQTGRYASGDELSNAKLLSKPPEIHTVTAGDDPALFPEGNCAQTPKHYRIDCRVGIMPLCGVGVPGPGPQPIPASWRFTAPLSTPRSNHTATLLHNGKVLVVGGGPSPQVYNPTLETWSDTAALQPWPHTQQNPDELFSNAKATRLADGRVLVVRVAPDIGNRVAQIYDSVQDSWTMVDAVPPGALNGHTVTLLEGSGKVLVTGLNNDCIGGPPGVGASSAVVFDPIARSWGPPIPMAIERIGGAMAVLLNDGRVLVAGGDTCSGTALRPPGAEIFDPATGTFLPTSRPRYELVQKSTMTVLAPGSCVGAAPPACAQVLMAGGSGGRKRAQLFNPADGSWSAATDMGGDRLGHTATLLTSKKKVLVTSGCCIDGRNSAETYDPTTDKWSAAPDMKLGTGSNTATLLDQSSCGNICGSVLVVGGSRFDSAPPGVAKIAVVQLYLPGSA